MNNVNRILIIFAIVVGAMLLGVWQFVQTERFAKFVSSRIQKTVKKQFDAKLDFNKLEVGLFPPSTKIKEVEIYKNEGKKNSLYVRAGTLGIYFSLFDFFGDDLTVDRIHVLDGVIKYNKNLFGTTEKDEDLSIKVSEFFEKYRSEIYSKLPILINNIQLDRIEVNLDREYVVVENFNVSMYPNYLAIDGLFEDINIKQLQENLKIDYDSISVNMELSKENLRIKEVGIRNKLESLFLEGIVSDSEESVFEGKVKYIGGADSIVKHAKLEIKELNDIEGFVKAEAQFKKKKNDYDLKLDIVAHDVSSKFAKIDEVKIGARKNKENLEIDRMTVKRRAGTVELLKPVSIFNLNKKDIIPNRASLNIKGLHSNDALYVARDNLNIIKGNIYGDVDVEWTASKVSFIPQKDAEVTRFRLMPFDGNTPILTNEKIIFNEGTFELINGTELLLDVDVKFAGSNIKAKGGIFRDQINIKINESTVDMVGFGPISGTPLFGKAKVSGLIKGPHEDVRLGFNVDVEDFEVADYHLGHLIGNIELSLIDTKLKIENVTGEREFTKFRGSGFLQFGENSGLDLKIDVARMNIEESYSLIKPVMLQFKDYLKNVRATYGGNIRVSGDFSDEKIRVGGKLRAIDIGVWNEDIDSMLASFLYANKKLTVSSFQMKKAAGFLRGSFSVDVGKEKFEYNGELSSLRLKDIYSYNILNLGYDGDIYGEFYGNGTFKDFNSRSQLRISNGSIGGTGVEDSYITVYNNVTDIFASGNVLGNMANFNSYFNFDRKKSEKSSYFKGEISTTNIKQLAGIISKHNIDDDSISGNISAKVETNFNFFKFEEVDFKFKLRELDVTRGTINLTRMDDKDEIIIKNGKIQKWDILVKGVNDQLSSVADGNFAEKFRIEQKASINSSIIETFTDKFQRSYGRFEARQVVIGNINEFSNYMEFESRDVFLKLKRVPNAFSKVNFKIITSGSELLFNKFNAQYGDGQIVGGGKIYFKLPFPEFDLKFNVENSKVSFLKRSSVVVSSNVSISGKKIPYVIGGNISIMHGSVEDELKDIAGNAIETEAYSRYAPQTNSSDKYEYFIYNLNVDIFNPILVSSSLAELKMIGNCSVKGSLSRPLMNGEFKIVPGSSKFMFKGHDFILNEGKLSLQDEVKKESPSIKFVGIANVNEYAVKLDVSGKVDNTKIELSSDPALTQEDILSLLTLGVTSDISKDLGERDRQSVTTMGLGSLLVDQLRLNEGLGTSLGLRLSVQPEFQQEDSSLLEGRTTDSDASSSKLKTATKIKLQKRITKDVDLSVSTTMGESTEQKQEMNIIYNIDKKWSLEGVYEIKSSDVEEEETPDSGGVDFKYKFTF